MSQHLAHTTVLSLRGRHLATPGAVGPTALPADPEQRRAEALDDPDGDLALYLMELFDAGKALADEITSVHADHRFTRPVWRRLTAARTAIATALDEIRDATRFSLTCALVEQDIADDDRPCDTALVDTVWVDLPDLGYDESGCPTHAAHVLASGQSTGITRIRPEARAILARLLSGHQLPPAEGQDPGQTGPEAGLA